MNNIHPTPGNHEYYTPGGTPYYKYFGTKAGDAGVGNYSFDVGTWHVISLNGEITLLNGYTPAQRLDQEAWLVKDLNDHKAAKCTIAYWHEPRFSSGYHGNDARFTRIWQILYDHEYERYLPQDPNGIADSTRGIIEIVAGTGGEELRGFGGRRNANSAYQIEGHPGILLLTLGAAEFKSAFLDTGGLPWDASGGKCH